MRVLSMKEPTDNRRVQQCATVDGMWRSRGWQLQGLLLTAVHVTALVWASAILKSPGAESFSSSSSSSSSPSSSSGDWHHQQQQQHHQPIRVGFEPVSIPPLSSVTCWNFSVGDGQLGELYSPNYGQHYPSKTECIHLITAPAGQRVRLDFRDDFHIEPSEDCGNDQLEIRDGPFGYSVLVGRFCGTSRPPLIESTGSHLWLRFYSDDSIEYFGFRAVYEYYAPKPAANNPGICRMDVDRENPDGLASDVDVPTLFRDRANRTRLPIDCTWVFQAQVPRQTVFLRWQKYAMSTIHLCDDSFLEVYDGTTGQLNRRQTFCDSTARDLRSTTSTMFLRLYASSVEKMPAFTVQYTYLMTEPCGDDFALFDCGDKTCVDRSLLCNGRHNCNTSRDESLCNNTTELVHDHGVPGTIRYHTLIIGIVGGAVLTITLLSICAAYRQTSKDRQLRRRRRMAASKMENHCSGGGGAGGSGGGKFELTEMQHQQQETEFEPASPGGGGGPHHHQQQQQPRGHPGMNMMATALVEPADTCSSPANHFDPRRFRRLSNGGSRPNTTLRTFQFVDNASSSLTCGPESGRGGSTEVDGGVGGRPDEPFFFNPGLDGGTRRKPPGGTAETATQCLPMTSTTQNVISAVATIEKLPSSPPVRGGGTASVAATGAARGSDTSWAARRDSTPSPRPDVVQDEKFFSGSCVPVSRSASSSGRGCAPSPPIRRTGAGGGGQSSGTTKRVTEERPSCNRTRSVENAATVSASSDDFGFYGFDNGATEESAATCGSYRDPEAIRSYRRLDFDDADDFCRKDATAAATAFVRFSPDWSAAVTLRRPPFSRQYTGLESSSVSARSAPSLIHPLFHGQNAYGSIHLQQQQQRGYRMPVAAAASATHSGAFTVVPSSGFASSAAAVRSSVSVPPQTPAAAATSSVLPANRTPSGVAASTAGRILVEPRSVVLPAPPGGLSSKAVVVAVNSTTGLARIPDSGASVVTLGDQKGALKAAATSGARTADGPNKSRRRSKSPDIFYTRPNRGILKS